MTKVSAWGRLTNAAHSVLPLSDCDYSRISQMLAETKPGIAFGNGRSYGDVCLNPGGTLWNTRGFDRYIRFDDANGILVCEPGVLLRDIQRLMVGRGWALTVTPGTQLITVGGAIANDVHGKNHHAYGTFGDYVRRLVLVRTDGEVIECGPDLRPEWFNATIGGMGLTGLILDVTLQLRRIKGEGIVNETVPYSSVEEFLQLADASERDWEHTVSWVDCAKEGRMRGLFMRGNPVEGGGCKRAERERTFAFNPPFSLVNRASLRAFNAAYFRLGRLQSDRKVSHYEKFLYPLDNIHDWNRLYGPAGFFQYQSVIPRVNMIDATKAMLREIGRSGQGSFLTVLKTFGHKPAVGLMSFPMDGVTLAMDFPNHGRRTLQLFDRLDAIVAEAHGRLYMAKDARMPKWLFESGYPRLGEFVKYRDPGIESGLSRRLLSH